MALRLHSDADVVFFLGDGLDDIESLAAEDESKMWVAVRGNCDFSGVFRGKLVPKTEEITVGGYKIVLTHGDLYGVKGTTEQLSALACERGADVVLFGHTHLPYEAYISDAQKPHYLFNPGSISSYNATYGIITLDGGVLLSHGSFV